MLSLPLTAQLQTLEFTIEVDITEPEQRESRGTHNFSIETSPKTINLLGSYSIDRGELPAKEGIGSPGYGGPDQPYDHKPHKPGSGWWEYTIAIIESVFWQPLYATQNVIGYSLLITPKDSSIHSFALSWIPLTVTLVVGWLESAHWNTESPLFNQIQEQEENRRSQLKIITVPSGTPESTSGSRGQKPSNPTVVTQASERPFSIANIPGNSGNNGGDRPPSQPCHTYNKSHCPICNRPCLKRPVKVIYNRDWVNSHTETHCNPVPDGSIACSVNGPSQTVGKKPGSYLVSSFAETSTVTTEAASTTGQSLKPPRVQKQKRTGFKKYPCDYPGCGRFFGSTDSLSSHKRLYHTGPKPCDVKVVGENGQQQACGEVFNHLQALLHHKRRDHTSPQTCDETVVGEGEQLQPCGRFFKNAQALMAHKSTHHSGPQTCDVTVVGENGKQQPCGEVCKHAQALYDHKRRAHAGPRTCDVTVVGENGEQQPCGEVCNNRQALYNHKRSAHAGPQTCGVTVVVEGEQLQPCGKVYKNPQALHNHKRRAHPSPRTCGVTVVGENGEQQPCGKVCKNRQALYDHKKRNHTGPQTCNGIVIGEDGQLQVCGKACNNEQALLHHKWRQHRKRKLDDAESND